MSVLDRGPALLFTPADRPDRVVKAATRADAVIVDLEDGVAPEDRERAREALLALDVDPAGVVVRLNPVGTSDFAADREAVMRTDFRTVMVAKTEAAAQLDAIPAGCAVIALCETARGIVHAEEIARHPAVIALMWGAEDLIASLGGTASRFSDGHYRDVARHARSRVLLAAGAAERAAIDAVHLDIADLHGLAEECRDGAAVGFVATACIHPSQVDVVRDAYRPDAAAVNRARRLLEAARGEPGVFRFDGLMVDEPVLRHARSLVARAERLSGR